MLSEQLIEYCAPTLAGIKTGSIFRLIKCPDDIIDQIRKLNHILTKKGLRLIPVKRSTDTMLLYLYRPVLLAKDLSDPKAAKILRMKGYRYDNDNCCLAQLVKHLSSDKSFPHEIGLFLGYPPEDVEGFLNDPCKGVKICGCWKAYGNEAEARKAFEKIRKCNDVYKSEAKRGKPLETMIVDTKNLRLAI